MERNSEQLVRHLKERYWYDAEQGVVRNRKNQVIKGFDDGKGYLKINCQLQSKRKILHVHRLVWALNYGALPFMIDHINGDPRDNRIENLREVSHSENDMNRVWAWKPNARTGLPGVSKTNDGFKIKCGGKQLNFRDKYEAFHALTMLGRMFREE
jgi:hypothetical protein